VAGFEFPKPSFDWLFSVEAFTWRDGRACVRAQATGRRRRGGGEELKEKRARR